MVCGLDKVDPLLPLPMAACNLTLARVLAALPPHLALDRL